jgi:son of sevenless-like protein
MGSITFTMDGNPDTRPSSLVPDVQLINQDKYNKLGKIAVEFERYQRPFNLHELEAVQTFLKRTLAERGSNSVDALYRKSCE